MTRRLVVALVCIGTIARADSSLLTQQQEGLARTYPLREARKLRNAGIGFTLGGLVLSGAGALLVTMFDQHTTSASVGLGAGIPALVIGVPSVIAGWHGWAQGQRMLDAAAAPPRLPDDGAAGCKAALDLVAPATRLGAPSSQLVVSMPLIRF